jgi:alpha-ketoglutarate-dependent taurine dioxygenase
MQQPAESQGPTAAPRGSSSPAAEAAVRFGHLDSGALLPRLATPAAAGVDLALWAAGHRGLVAAELARYGGLLFRGFGLADAGAFERAAEALAPGLLQYSERSSPRSQVHGNVYTSTDYPPSQPIFLHNENSYQHAWPMRICFFCACPADAGGETPIADCRRVYQRIDPAIRQRFVDRRWLLVRNFGEGFGLSWETVFQTPDRAAVDAYCREHGIVAEWRGEGRLRTRAVRPAVARHPGSGEMVWFNHATFFHVSTLPEEVREGLLGEFALEDLPANSFYGDGSAIEPDTLDHLREAYEAETVRFAWRQGDLLLLDNMMVAHGRAPFRGPRKILVAMAQPCGWAEVAATAP